MVPGVSVCIESIQNGMLHALAQHTEQWYTK